MPIAERSQVKLFLQITGTEKDSLIDALIPQAEEDYLFIRNTPFEIDDLDNIIYPVGSDYTVSLMIGFMMTSQMQNGGAMSSESIGSYSYSKDNDLKYGYPKNIIQKIQRYAQAS